MFKRYEQRGHVFLQLIPLRIQVLPVPIQPKTFRFPQGSLDFKRHEQRRV